MGRVSGTTTADEALGWRRAAGLHLIVAAALVLVVWQSAEHLPLGESALDGRLATSVADGVLGPWLYWDVGAFSDIAEHGYRSEDRLVYDAGGEARIAYFPGYPLAARGVGTLIGDIPLGMIAVTFLSGVGAVVLFHRWLRLKASRDAVGHGLLALVLFPWAFFLVGAGYSDALFLLAALGAFVLMEEDRPAAAAAAGIVATLTRPVGGAVTVGLLVIAWQQRRREARTEAGVGADSRPWSAARLPAAATSILGLVLFMAFCWSRYGNPLAFSAAQRGWDQGAGPRTWFKLTFVDLLQRYDDPWFEGRLAIHGVVALLFVAAVPAVWRRFGAAYGAYTAIVVVVPFVGSAWFASLGRYMLAAFPVFAMLGERLTEWGAAKRYGFLALSAAGLLLNASFWARGYWMG